LANLSENQAALQAIGNALGPNGDLLIYGCDVAEGADGTSFVDAIAAATGVTVAASSHLIGDVAAGDGWNLDVQTGAIDAPSVLNAAALDAYTTPLLLNDPPTGLPISITSFSSSSGFLLGGLTSSSAGASITSGGVLQLTNNGFNQKGIAVYSTAFPSSDGISVQFTYYSGGKTGVLPADGLSFFLINADTAGAASNIVAGQSGGGLGYSDDGAAGITDGFLGLGFDTYGNYSAADKAPQTGTGFAANSIAVRGAGNGTTGYALLSTVKYTPGIDGIRSVRINLVNVAATSTAAAYELLSVFMSTNGGTTFQEVITNEVINQVLPSNFYLGFASSTGASDDFHQITNLSVTLPVALTVSAPVVSYPAADLPTHTLLPGDAFSYTYTITNNGPNGSSEITVQDAPPSNVTGVHWTLQDDLNPGNNPETGIGAINLSNVNLSSGDVATITVYGTISSTALTGNADHIITVTPGAGFNFLTPSTGQVGLSIGSPTIYVIDNTTAFASTDTATVQPFGLLQVTDANAGALDSASIVLTGTAGTATDADGLLSGTGLTKTAVGTYALTAATAASLSSELDALIFTPTNHQVAPGSAVTTGFTLTVADGVVASVVTSTTVVATALETAPTFSGTVSTQAVTDTSALSRWK
jgi:uncharacterized repeat protein (TIGR01451 family)